MSRTILVEYHTSWARIRIARPEKRNALDRGTRRALGTAIADLEPGTRAVVLTGTDTSFCAGLDLKERATEIAAGRSDTAGEEAIALNMVMRSHPAVFIAGVNGLALGGGMTLVNSCDLAIAAEDAEFGTPEISFATYASMAGPTARLLLNRKRAGWLLLTGERISASTAHNWGLVNEVVTADHLEARCAELAARIAGFDATALSMIKATLDAVPGAATDWREVLIYGQGVNAAIRNARGRPGDAA
ncbi:enoyl-CoA hydratase/isomerase family protein [Methylobacterium sp. J-030]|uniref:enoyl-CoA hydratase/isomerase family protein n=1 Tax=Methylobacterium sp. J-030 TaxID=2836627 RepID=UPI001FB9E2A9|nr:enoyl-CoA hydratase/isomerase family protein [Methylobacterium sp. J-030]MCJ2070806.1 enoyl-CoA hydratase/isomerase family protein [Methylobacterium sp. J-030]